MEIPRLAVCLATATPMALSFVIMSLEIVGEYPILYFVCITERERGREGGRERLYTQMSFIINFADV